MPEVCFRTSLGPLVSENELQTILGVGWSRRDVAAMEMFPQKGTYKIGAFDPIEEVRPDETDH